MASPESDALAVSASSRHSEQEEGVLADVLAELDRERSKRAELQAKIRRLEEQLAKKQTKEEQEQQISRRAFLAMEAQVQGFTELVDEITRGKPAIAAAAAQANTGGKAKNIPKTLPLHVVRLLEVMPWDPRARPHIFGWEKVYEWQIFDATTQKWQSNLKYFPKLFHAQPIVKPKAGGVMEEEETTKERNLLVFLAGGDRPTAPSKHGVITNEHLTQILHIEAGFPLPRDGGNWQWIGGWRIDKRQQVDATAKPSTNGGSTSPTATTRQKVDCDDRGWSYAQEAQHFLVNPTEWVWDNPGMDENNIPKRKMRRRKWTRQRVLVDYPFCSERTQKYLGLLAENARLSVTCHKVSEQLVQTKVGWTESEEALMRAKEEAALHLETMRKDLQRKDELLQAAGVTDDQDTTAKKRADSDGGNAIKEFLSKNEQVKEIGSKISQWVRKSSEDFGSNHDDDDSSVEMAFESINSGSAAADETSSKGSKFDWKKIGRGALFDKVKPPTGSSHKSRREAHESTRSSDKSKVKVNESKADGEVKTGDASKESGAVSTDGS